MTEQQHTAQEELALFALQALPKAEQDAVRAHVAECSVCREELARLQGDVALLALSVEQHPLPAGARERLLERIANQPQSASNVVHIESGKTAKKIYSSVSWSLAAALLIFSVGSLLKVGQLNMKIQQQAEQLKQQEQDTAQATRALDVLTAKNAQHITLTSAQAHPEPEGRAVYLASTGGLIFQASHLDPLPADKTYELWVIPADGKAPIPAGLFKPDATGSASVVLPQIPVGVRAKAFGVTMEAAQGSKTPTLPILLAGAAGE
ncbi:MAG: anti-sigma factor [Acidobacteriota bacterium]|nr:anti-sigma factor [Acidobacteriota bacterium]